MSNASRNDETVFPSNENSAANCAWAVLVAVRDLELLSLGSDERLMETLHIITGKKDRSDAESTYLHLVLRVD